MCLLLVVPWMILVELICAAALLATRTLNLNSVGKHQMWFLLSQAETVLLKHWVYHRVNLMSTQSGGICHDSFFLIVIFQGNM